MEVWNQFGAVILVLGLLVGALMWLKNRGFAVAPQFNGWSRAGRSKAKTRELEVIDRVMVSAQHTLVLLAVKDTRMLICLSPGGSNVTVLKDEH